MSKAPKKGKLRSASRQAAARTPSKADFDEVVRLIDAAKARAIAAVNTALIDLHWALGEYISRRVADNGWGQGTVKTLAEHIARRRPNVIGFSARNLWRMMQFYETYRDRPKLSPLVTELSWTHNLIVMSRCKRDEEREFYLRLCIREKWGKRELQRQLDGALFERVVLSPAKLSAPLRELHPPPKPPQAVAKSSALRKVPQAAAQLTDSIPWAIAGAQATGTAEHMGPAPVDCPCLRVLVSRFFSRRPEGAATNQPRATPWDRTARPRSRPERARQGDPFVTPLQGFRHVRIPIPRALPWAFLFGPVGANSRTARHQNLCVALVCNPATPSPVSMRRSHADARARSRAEDCAVAQAEISPHPAAKLPTAPKTRKARKSS